MIVFATRSPVLALAGKVLAANVVWEKASAPVPIVRELAAIVSAARASRVASQACTFVPITRPRVVLPAEASASSTSERPKSVIVFATRSPVDARAGNVLEAKVVWLNASAPVPIVKLFAAIVKAARASNVASHAWTSVPMTTPSVALPAEASASSTKDKPKSVIVLATKSPVLARAGNVFAANVV